MGKNYAAVGTEANLQARYIGKNEVINCQINRGVLVNRDNGKTPKFNKRGI